MTAYWNVTGTYMFISHVQLPDVNLFRKLRPTHIYTRGLSNTIYAVLWPTKIGYTIIYVRYMINSPPQDQLIPSSMYTYLLRPTYNINLKIDLFTLRLSI